MADEPVNVKSRQGLSESIICCIADLGCACAAELTLKGFDVTLCSAYAPSHIKPILEKEKVSLGLFFDEQANQQQREALQMIFTEKAGGFMAEFAKLIGEVRGLEFAPIKFEVADDLGHWSAEIPGKGGC